jgi:hypothetical protein
LGQGDPPEVIYFHAEPQSRREGKRRGKAPRRHRATERGTTDGTEDTERGRRERQIGGDGSWVASRDARKQPEVEDLWLARYNHRSRKDRNNTV